MRFESQTTPMFREAIIVFCIVTSLAQSAFASELRVASWNMANLPNDSVHTEDLRTILQAMGDEDVLGIARPVDILSMSETDRGSAIETVGVFNELYPTSTYKVEITEPDGGGDRTAFVYNSSTISLTESIELSEGLTHNTLRGDFRPKGIPEALIVRMYSVHLKSGGDNDTQGDEAEIIRLDADSLGPNAHLIYGGDFNWHRAEDAWDVFVGEGNGQAFDTFDINNIGGAGPWRDNEECLVLHSQDAREQMDDRFDMQFVTDEFFDGTGLELVPGSYRVFGNNGTHELKKSITTGQGAAPAVLNALASFSDHLPVVSDFTFDEFVVGDLDGDGVLAATDIDAITAAMNADSDARHFDLTADCSVNSADHTHWVRDLKNTWFGDANLDGVFNTADLVAVFQAGEYEDGIAINSGWATGDWNGDAEFGSGDLVFAFQDGGYEQGARTTTQAVPEPTSLVTILTALVPKQASAEPFLSGFELRNSERTTVSPMIFQNSVVSWS